MAHTHLPVRAFAIELTGFIPPTATHIGGEIDGATSRHPVNKYYWRNARQPCLIRGFKNKDQRCKILEVKANY